MTGNRNNELRLELLRRYGTQLEASHVLGIHVSKLSLLLNRHVQPTTSEHEKFSQALGSELTTRLLGERPVAVSRRQRREAAEAQR